MCINLICYDVNDQEMNVKYPTEVVSMIPVENKNY
jgi:hypothetical protein